MLGHVTRRALGADHDTEEIDAHDLIVIGQVIVEQPGERARHAGVVEHHVEPTEMLDREVDELLDFVRVGNVGPLERGCRAKRRRQLLAPLRVHVGDDDLRSFRHEQLSGGAADPAGAPRDDRDLPRKLLAHRQLVLSIQ